MVEIPPEVLAAFAVPARQAVELGDVYELRPPHAYYFNSQRARPTILIALECAPDGTPVWAWGLYTTTKRVPARLALELSAGEGGLRDDCRLDFRKAKEIDVASLLADCPKLGRLDTHRLAEIETMLPASPLSPRVKALPR